MKETMDISFRRFNPNTLKFYRKLTNYITSILPKQFVNK